MITPYARGMLSGLGAITPVSISMAGAITTTGRVTSAGFTSSTDGTAGTPAYNFTSLTNMGLYRTGNYMAAVQGGAERQYLGTDFVVESAILAQFRGRIDGQGGFGLVAPPAVKTADYTMAVGTDFLVEFDTTSVAITVSLPTAASAVRVMFAIRKSVAHANALTIDPNGAELIDGAATLVVANSTTAWVQSNGTAWRVVGVM